MANNRQRIENVRPTTVRNPTRTTTKRFALLAQALERNANDAMEQQRRSAASLQKTAIDANSQLQASAREAGKRLERLLDQAVDRNASG